MLKLDTRIDLDYQQFFRWWGNELAFLVPTQLAKWLGAGRERVCLIKDEGQLQLLKQSADSSTALALWPLEDLNPSQRVAWLAQHPELEEVEWVLRLSPEQAWHKVFKLPAAAEENLKQVVGFELDKLTPFSLAQVYFDVKVLARIKETKQIKVRLALAPRRVLDPLLEELHTAGWKPNRADVALADGQLLGMDLLPPQYRLDQSPWPKRLTIAAGVLLFGLLIGVLVLPVLMNQAIVADLQAQVKAANKVALEVQELRENAEKLTHENDFLLKKKREEPAMVDMLEELSEVIPPDTSLNGLQYRDRKVILQGMSPSASSLIAKMEASPFLKATSFVSPVTKDISNGQERFQIATEVVNGRVSEKPAQ